MQPLETVLQPAAEVELTGWLLKKGALGLLRLHKRRWFHFNGPRGRGRVVYWESEHETEEPKGEIEVNADCSVRVMPAGSGDLLDFELLTPLRVYLLRAECLEDMNRWVAGLHRFIESCKRDDDFVLMQAEHPSCDYIVIDLNASQERPLAGPGAEGSDESLTDSDAPPPPELAELFRRVQVSGTRTCLRLSDTCNKVIDSAPRSNGLLALGSGEDASPLGKATRVVSCLKRLLGPPPRADSGMGIGSVLRNLSEDQIEWLAPLLLALEKDDVTEVILHLAASGSPVLRMNLIALHASGFMATYARASVNSLFQITNAERNTLRLSDFLSSHGDEVVVGQPFPVEMVHPFSSRRVDSVVVKKVFATAAKPMMLEFRAGDETVPPLILTKDGDDLRVDLQVQLMFRVFNSLWEVYGFEFKVSSVLLLVVV